MKVLANDGISPSGKKKLEEAGFTVETNTVEQDKLIDYINANDVSALCVRSATKVRKEVFDACPGLRFVGRGGVGMDNIDVEYGRSKGVTVANTPASSSQSVAELVMAHLFSLARSTYDANRQMPQNGSSDFKALKKKYGKGMELRGKTLGIIGFGRIGQALAQYALGSGMRVICTDLFDVNTIVKFTVEGYGEVSVNVEKVDMNTLLKESDAISVHVPKQEDGSAVIAKEQFDMMKDGVIIVNAARGGVIDEPELLKALDSGKVKAAALDVFENEPTPDPTVLAHEKLALSPHIGAATVEAQGRIGAELADLIIGELTPA